MPSRLGGFVPSRNAPANRSSNVLLTRLCIIRPQRTAHGAPEATTRYLKLRRACTVQVTRGEAHGASSERASCKRRTVPLYLPVLFRDNGLSR